MRIFKRAISSLNVCALTPLLMKEKNKDLQKKIVLKVVKQCVATEGVDAAYVKESILPEFFRHFWVRRMALDR
jgi:hypothetical protein